METEDIFRQADFHLHKINNSATLYEIVEMPCNVFFISLCGDFLVKANLTETEINSLALPSEGERAHRYFSYNYNSL